MFKWRSALLELANSEQHASPVVPFVLVRVMPLSDDEKTLSSST